MLTCPLCCKKVNKLHENSHLIAEWMYKEYYDKRHKLINIELDTEIVNKKQKGVYANKIICEECELESQIYDRYGSLVLTKRSPNAIQHNSVVRKTFEKLVHGRLYQYSHWMNIDFARFQRFVFATVLRTHLSEKQKGKYLLVDKHFENIRKIYKDINISNDHSYPIMVMKYPEDDKLKDHVFIPFINKKSGHHFIEFAGGGYSFWIFVSNHAKSDYVYSMSIKQDGSMYMLHEYFERCGTFKAMLPTLKDLGRKFPEV